jgi:hypothetical protein
MRTFIKNLKKLLETSQSFTASAIEASLGLGSGAISQKVGDALRAPSGKVSGTSVTFDVLLNPKSPSEKQPTLFLFPHDHEDIDGDSVIALLGNEFGPAVIVVSKSGKGESVSYASASGGKRSIHFTFDRKKKESNVRRVFSGVFFEE